MLQQPLLHPRNLPATPRQAGHLGADDLLPLHARSPARQMNGLGQEGADAQLLTFNVRVSLVVGWGGMHSLIPFSFDSM